MGRQPLIMKDPILLAGSAHTAIVNVPVSPSGMACTAELFLSADGEKTKATTSGAIPFTSTGILQSISLPVVMPTVGGIAYGVYINIVSGGVVIAAYQGTEHVIVPLVGAPTIAWG